MILACNVLTILVSLILKGSSGFFFWGISIILPPMFLLKSTLAMLFLVPMSVLVIATVLWWKWPNFVSFWCFTTSLIGWCMWAYYISHSAFYNI